MQASRARTERLWKDYLRDPSKWCDNRKNKTNPNAPDFKNKLTRELLWMGGQLNPSWAKDRLRLEETEERSAIQGIYKAQEEEEEEEEEENDTGSCWRMLSLEKVLLSLEEGVLCPSVKDFAHIMHQCKKARYEALALRLHAYMLKSRLEAHRSLGNYLVSMLVEVGSMLDAQQVFDRLVYQNELSWNSLITGYVKYGRPRDALALYQKMQKEDSVHPNGHTFVALLKACAKLKDLERGLEIHAEVARTGLLKRDLFVGSTLVDMYAKCGSLSKAQKVFDKLPIRNVVSWNALIAGYAEHGHDEEALKCFEQMLFESVSPNAVTYLCSLKACGNIGATDKVEEIHAEIERKGLLERHLFVGSTLVDTYAKCGLLAKAQEVFDKLPIRNVVSWTSLIAGYAEHGHGKEALKYFEQMQVEGVSPDAVTFVYSLKACGSIGATDKGQEIHAEIERNGLLEKNLFVGSSLVDMYTRCGLISKAQEVFDKLPVRNIFSWNALIAGYAKHGHGEKALKCFEQMQLEGVSPDPVTFLCCLKACGIVGATDKGGQIHAEIARKGLLETDLVVGSTLVDMYAKCGLLAKAQQVFDKLPVQDVVSWNALIAGYAEHGHGEEALKYFELMQLKGVSPDAVTFVCSLKACGSIGATDKGREMHAEVERKGLLERDTVVGNTLVDMYAKCGSLAIAQQVFDKLPVRDIVSWNSLITGYTQLGESENVFDIYERMLGEGIKPDPVTFIIVLNACSRTGLFNKSQTYFQAMSKDYGMVPTHEHHSCIVDLLGRAGQLDKAVAMIKKMPFCPNLSVWHTVLGACRNWGNVELGKQALECALCLDENDAAAYVLMSHIYAGADWEEKAHKVNATRVEKQACKR